jgi:hypothetical protein
MKNQSISDCNAAARLISQTLQDAGSSPECIAVTIQRVYALAGIHFFLPFDFVDTTATAIKRIRKGDRI